MRRGPVLSETFETSPNALNLVRLLLATWVLVWHANALPGHTYVLPRAVTEFVAGFGVDGFFAISGFLIVRAWVRRPRLIGFVLARARRIMPGFVACLVVTAFAIVPAACWLAGVETPFLAARLSYVWSNLDLSGSSSAINGPLTGLHDPNWDGSLWTLEWEVWCYVAVAALGALRLLRPVVVLGLVVALWSLTFALSLQGIEPGGGMPLTLWMPQRAGLLFGCGALLYLYGDRVRVNPAVMLLSAVTVVTAVALLPNYRLLAAPAVGYLLLAGALYAGRSPRLVLRHDISFGVYLYAFPLQQALILVGFGSVGLVGFAVLSIGAVLPFAVASWLCVERPLVRRRSRRAVPGSAAFEPLSRDPVLLKHPLARARLATSGVVAPSSHDAVSSGPLD